MAQRLLGTLRLGIAALAAILVLSLASVPFLHAQSDKADWEKAAGGKMEFDVASVVRNTSGYPPGGPPPRSNFPLDSGDGYSANGGLFAATNWPVGAYIGFAYKLTPTSLGMVRRQLPKWTATDHFDVQARARGNPTKDQMRLMMESLLADRFKLVLHHDVKQMAVYGLSLEKAGKTGRQLVIHSETAPCAVINDAPASTAAGGTTLPYCGTLTGKLENGHMHVESRGITMQQIADYLPSMGMAALDRPVLDRTQLSGTYDFILEWTPDDMTLESNGMRYRDDTGQGFVGALKDQLGLKLESQTAPVAVFVIDHVEEPSAN